MLRRLSMRHPEVPQEIKKEVEAEYGKSELPKPSAGSPAYEAMLANDKRPVSRIEKLVKRTKRKAPIKPDPEYADSEPYRPPGKLINAENDMYVLTIGMMLGLRVSVINSIACLKKEGRENTHLATKYVFPPAGNPHSGLTGTPKHHLSHTFKFKDYAPWIFHRIRIMSGIDSRSYMDSVCGEMNYIQFTSNSKSGQFFFFTKDGDYMIKTVTYDETKELRHVLKDYYEHLKRYPHSFLVRIYGLHRVQMYHLNRTVYFIVMGSVFRGAQRNVHRQYDIKGSRVGRSAEEGETVRKDNDLLEDGFKLQLGRNKDPVLEQLKRDVRFMQRAGFVDYSLLIGVSEDRSKLAAGAMESADGDTGPITRRSTPSDATQPESLASDEGGSPNHQQLLLLQGKGLAESTMDDQQHRGAAAEEDDQDDDDDIGAPHTPLDDVHQELHGIGDDVSESGRSSPSVSPARPPQSRASRSHNQIDVVTREKASRALSRSSTATATTMLRSVFGRKGSKDVNSSSLSDPPATSPKSKQLSGGALMESCINESMVQAMEVEDLATKIVEGSTEEEDTMDRPDLFRRYSYRTLQYRATKKWEQDVMPNSLLQEERNITNRVQVRLRQDGAFRLRHDFGFEGNGCDEVYYFGVIDFLTRYNLKKMAERNIKAVKYDKKGLSVAPSDDYAQRFLKFIANITVGEELPPSPATQAKRKPKDFVFYRKFQGSRRATPAD